MRKRVEGSISTWLVPLGMLLVALMWVALVMGYRHVAADVELPDDSHLIPVRSEVADADNGYVVLMASTGLYVKVELEDGSRALGACREMVAGEREWDEEMVEGVLASNAAFLAAIEECADLPAFRSPAPQGFTSLLPHIQPAMHGGKLLSLQSAVALRQGKQEEAAAAAGKACRLGRKLLEAAPCLINGLVGSAVYEMGLDSYMRLARDGASVAQLREWRAADGGWRLGYDSLIMCMQGEYVQVKQTIREMGQMSVADISALAGAGSLDGGGWTRNPLERMPLPGFAYQPNRTVGEIQQILDHWLAELEKPVWEREPELFECRTAELRERFPFCRNPVGTVLLSMFLPAYGSVTHRWDETDLVAAMIEPVAALHAFRRATGALPESLEELVPAYLAAVPMDPFSGEPMKVDLERGMVYSVGRDGADDGGDEGSKEPWERAKDLIFRVDERVWDGEV